MDGVARNALAAASDLRNALVSAQKALQLGSPLVLAQVAATARRIARRVAVPAPLQPDVVIKVLPEHFRSRFGLGRVEVLNAVRCAHRGGSPNGAYAAPGGREGRGGTFAMIGAAVEWALPHRTALF